MQFIRLHLLSILAVAASASPTEPYDGTISYFNTYYHPQDDMEPSPETEMYTKSHHTEPMHKAKVGVNGIESKICTTKRAAEKDAICLYLREKGGEAEVRRVRIVKSFLLRSP